MYNTKQSNITKKLEENITKQDKQANKNPWGTAVTCTQHPLRQLNPLREWARN